jgi:uncharacterized protein YggE
MSTRHVVVAGAGLAAVAFVAVACGNVPASPAAAPAGATPSTPTTVRTITATAQGQASGTPDLLTISLGVETSAPDAASALSSNNQQAGSLIAKLKADGVAAADLQTTELRISPTYTQGTPSQPPQIDGYTVDDEVVAKLRQLDSAGQVIDDAAAAAGNDIRLDSIAYSIDDDSALLTAARADAVRQAGARARAMAAAAGVSVGAVQTITDLSQPGVEPVPTDVEAASAGAAALPPLQAGTEQVTVDVSVVFAIAG